MAKVIIYSSANCSYCQQAKMLLDKKQVSYTEIRVDLQPELRDEMVSLSGGVRSVPQIFINDLHVGGCDDLYALERAGKLDALLTTSI